MAMRELRRMKRMELLDIIYALQQNEEKLQAEIAALKQQLEERTIKLEDAGSIADAALSLHGIFETAQAAADQYLESVRIAGRDAQKRADTIIREAEAKAAKIIAEAEKKRTVYEEE